MKLHSLLVAGTFVLLFFAAAGTCYGLSVGQQAHEFNLINTQGKTFDLSQLKERPMTVLYFFDIDSRPSQEGLLSLDHLVTQYPEIDLKVWGITLSPRKKAIDFVAKTQPEFPVLLDDSGVSDRYNARKLLPTIYILGPELKVLDVIQGGGKAAEVMLVRLAERNLQRKKTQMVKTIIKQVEENDPENLEAKVLKAYAALKEGNLDEAKKIFEKLSEKKGQGEILAKEGLAMVYAKKGEDQTALVLAHEVEEQAPNRAVSKKEGASFQRAVALNQLGRIAAIKGNYREAQNLYDQAVDIDPYYVEAMTNKGIIYGKEGRWEDALQANRKAMAIEKQDTFAATLAKNAEKMLALQKDTERKKRLDELVRELTERYRKQENARPQGEDSWTSGPMVMTFIDFQEKGGLAEQDGLATVLTTQLGDVLNDSGRVEVVERVVVDSVFEELKIGSSDLAEPDAALKLGRILAAKLIGTGSLFFLPESTLLNLRLIDTETSAIQKVLTRTLGPQASLDQELFWFNREILSTIIKKYPLQGFLIQVKDDQVMINLGEKQGVVQGTTFEVLEEQQPINYKGKVLRGAATAIGQIEIVKVEPDLSFARIVIKEKAFEKGVKVKEKITTPLGPGERRDQGL